MIYKKVYGIIFPNDMTTNKIQEDFLEHYQKFNPVLNELKQTSSQQDSTFALITTSVIESKSLNSNDFLQFVTFPVSTQNSIVPPVRSVASAFLDESLNVSKKFILKDTHILKNNFLIEAKYYTATRENALTLKREAQELGSYIIQENPYFRQSIKKFLSSFHIIDIQHLNTLIEFAKMQELLTHFSLSQQMSLSMGFKLYALTYYSIQKAGGFKAFLIEIKREIQNPSLISIFGKVSNIVYQNR